MTGKPDYGPGDLVQCVLEGAIKCPNTPCTWHRGSDPRAARKPYVARVVSMRPSIVKNRFGEQSTCGCTHVELDDGREGNHLRFKKVDPLPPEMWTRDVDVDLLAEREKEDA